jgi:hypothetical protein
MLYNNIWSGAGERENLDKRMAPLLDDRLTLAGKHGD